MNAVLNYILLLLYIYLFFYSRHMLIFVFKKSWLTACRVKSILQPNANLQPNQRLWFCIVPDAYKTQQCDNWFIAQTTGLIMVCFLGNLSYTIRLVPDSIRIDSRIYKTVSEFEWVPWLSNNLFFVFHRSLTIVRDASGTIKKCNQIFFKAKFFV